MHLLIVRKRILTSKKHTQMQRERGRGNRGGRGGETRGRGRGRGGRTRGDTAQFLRGFLPATPSVDWNHNEPPPQRGYSRRGSFSNRGSSRGGNQQVTAELI